MTTAIKVGCSDNDFREVFKRFWEMVVLRNLHRDWLRWCSPIPPARRGGTSEVWKSKFLGDWGTNPLCRKMDWLRWRSPIPPARRGGTSEVWKCKFLGDWRTNPLRRKMELASLTLAHPIRSPRGHFRSLKVSLTLFFVVYVRLWTSSHDHIQQKKALRLQGFQTSGGRWCFYTISKNLSTSIYRPF